MSRTYRKYIMDDYKEVLKKMQKIGAENIKGISGEREAMNTVTHEFHPYYTVYYNKNAEFEISPKVLNKLIELGILTLC